MTRLILFLCITSISLGQLEIGQFSVAGMGYTRDDSDSYENTYSKYKLSAFTSVLSYNIKKNLSLDAKMVSNNLNRNSINGNKYKDSSTAILVGASYFWKNNIFITYMSGNYKIKDFNDYYFLDETLTEEYKYTASIAIIGYRFYLNPAVSLDIGYHLYQIEYDSDFTDKTSQIEFLIRMFL